MTPRALEAAFAAEMAAHCAAAAELNPYAEAESLELGTARAVYCGAWSPVHGVAGLGLDGPVEARDLAEVERFFHRKERAPAFWICPETDPSLLELIRRDYHETRKVAVHGISLKEVEASLPAAAGSSKPDLTSWALEFTRALDPGAREPGLLALTKLHQKDTRYYQSIVAPSALLDAAAGEASYTFVHHGIALVPAPSSLSLLALQAAEAKEWNLAFLAACHEKSLPLVYERSLYERL